MSITTEQVSTLHNSGGNVVSTSGAKIGSIGQIYLDNTTDEPTWVTVKTGLFGTSESFVPLATATVQDTDVVVDYDKDTIKDAPRLDPAGAHLTQLQPRLPVQQGLEFGAAACVLQQHSHAQSHQFWPFSSGLYTGPPHACGR